MGVQNDFVIKEGVLEKYEGAGGSVRIPDGVSKIADSAFSRCSGVTEVVVPDRVTEICSHAFFCCTDLQRAVLPSGLSAISVGMFWGCEQLEEIRIPEHVKKIDAFAFEGCTSLRTIKVPESVREIGAGAWNGCSSLVSIALPSSVQIRGSVLDGCCSLETVDAPPEVKRQLYGQMDIEWMYTKNHERFTPGLTREIFANFADMGKTVKNKKALLCAVIDTGDAEALRILLDMKYIAGTKVRDELIERAAALEHPEVTALLLAYKERTANQAKEEKARGKKMEKELSMSAEEAEMAALKAEWNFRLRPHCSGEYEIRGYKGKDTIIHVPASIGGLPVTRIGEKAFSSFWQKNEARKKALDAVTEIHIPDSVKDIGESAFSGCRSLKTLQLPDCLDSLGREAFMGCASLERLKMPDIRGGLVRDKMFKYCSSLREIAVPRRESWINTSDFSCCTSLTDVVIPAQVEEIRGYAFMGCSGLKAVHIHGGVKKIYKTAFQDCTALTIYGPAGGLAEQYAKEKGIPFVPEG